MQVRLAWERMLAKQPGFEEGPGRAALRGLIEKRLQGKLASTKASAACKKIFDVDETGFVMCKVRPGSACCGSVPAAAGRLRQWVAAMCLMSGSPACIIMLK